MLVKETRHDPARRATPCPSRYQDFRSLLIGFINRFGAVSVALEGSFGVHDSGEKNVWFVFPPLRVNSRSGEQSVYFDCRNREKSWL